MAIGILTATCARTPSGRYDLKFPDGIETPTPPDITIATIPTQTLTAGTSYSQDFATYVSGTDKPGSTYAIEAISGTLAAIDLTFTTSTLSGATPDAGSFTGRLAVSKSGYTFRSNNFVITVNPAAATDTQAPSIPPPPTVVINSSTSATVSGHYSMDVRTAAVNASGLDAMILQRCTVTNGIDGTFSDVATISAPGDGFTSLYSEATIGTPSGSPTVTQTLSDYAISAGLGVLGSTSDSCKYFYWQLTGDFELIVTLPDFAHGDDAFAASIPMIRQNLTAGSPYYRARRWSNASGKGIGASWRTSQGATPSSSTAVTANIPTDVRVIVSRVASTNTWTTTFIDTAGNPIQVNQQVVPMTDPVLVGGTGIRSISGANITFQFKDVIVNTQGTWDEDDTTVASTSYRWRLRARDNSSNVSGVSPSTAIYTTPAVVSNYKRVHPGWYMLLDNADITPARMQQHFAHIDQIANEPSIKGVKLTMYHGKAESTLGNYSNGFAIVDEYLKRCKAAGNKKFMLSIFKQVFSGNMATDPNFSNGYYFPTYITSNPSTYGITQFSFGSGAVERVWQQPTMDRWIAMGEAFAGRYDGGVALDDGHTHFLECYQTGETAIAVTLGTNGYSIANLLTQLKRLVDALSQEWTNTIIRCATNYLGSAEMQELIAYCVARDVACGGPDIIAKEAIEANRVWCGYTGGIDYRGNGCWIIDFQAPSMGGKDGDLTMAQAVAALGGTSIPPGIAGFQSISPTHCVVYRKDWSQGSTGGIMWNAPRASDGAPSILSYMQANPMPGQFQASCPISFPGCDFS